MRGCEQGATVERSETGERAMFAPAGRITARAGWRSKLAAIVLAAKRAASQQRDFFASFLVTKRKALEGATHDKRASPHGGDARRAQHHKDKKQNQHNGATNRRQALSMLPKNPFRQSSGPRRRETDSMPSRSRRMSAKTSPPYKTVLFSKCRYRLR